MENFLETFIKMLYDASWSDGCGRSAPSALVGKRGWRAVARQSGGKGRSLRGGASFPHQRKPDRKPEHQKPETESQFLITLSVPGSVFRFLVSGSGVPGFPAGVLATLTFKELADMTGGKVIQIPKRKFVRW